MDSRAGILDQIMHAEFSRSFLLRSSITSEPGNVVRVIEPVKQIGAIVKYARQFGRGIQLTR